MTMMRVLLLSGLLTPESLPLGAGWSLSGTGSRVETVRGEPALRLRNGEGDR